MRKLVIVVAVLGALGLVVELAAPPFAESRIEEQASERTHGVASVTADVRSFPMVTRVLVTGRVRRVVITLGEVVRQRLSYATVAFDLHGLELDRGALLRQETQIEGLDRGTIVGEIDAGALGDAFGVTLDLDSIDIQARRGELTLHHPDLPPLTAPLDEELFPCDPEVEVEVDRIVVSCEITDVPEILFRATRNG